MRLLPRKLFRVTVNIIKIVSLDCPSKVVFLNPRPNSNLTPTVLHMICSEDDPYCLRVVQEILDHSKKILDEENVLTVNGLNFTFSPFESMDGKMQSHLVGTSGP